MEDDDAFDKANEEFGKTLEESGLWDQILEAREQLKTAEGRLVEYGLSIAPGAVRETLKKAVKENYTTRQKVIDLALRLDASTVARAI